MARKTTTSSAVRQRWEAANYKKYMVRLRIDTDSEAIDYIESRKAKGENTSEIFREAIEKLKNEG